MTEKSHAEMILDHKAAAIEYDIAYAKAVVRHRGEGSDLVIKSLALVDVEAEFRAVSTAAGAIDAIGQPAMIESYAAAGEYHRELAKPFDQRAKWSEPKELER